MENYVNCYFEITQKSRHEQGKLQEMFGTLEDLLGIQQHEITGLIRGRLKDKHKVHLLLMDIFDELVNTHFEGEEYQYEDLIDLMPEKEIGYLVNDGYLDVRDPDAGLIEECDILFNEVGDIIEIDTIMNHIRELKPTDKVTLKEQIASLGIIHIDSTNLQKKGREFIFKMLEII